LRARGGWAGARSAFAARLHAARARLAQRQRCAAGRHDAHRRGFRCDPGVRACDAHAAFAVRLQSGARCVLVAPGGDRALAGHRAVGRFQRMDVAAPQRLGRRMGRHLALFLVLFVTSAAGAETIGTVSSPGNVLSVSVTVNDEGRPGYTVSRGGRQIVTESRLGFLLTDAPKLERNFTGDGVETRSVDETWEQPWGERRYVRNHY